MSRTLVGIVSELWRYPVSSVAGEQVEVLELVDGRVPGDRSWCLVDAETGKAAAPELEERWRPALFLSSRLGPDGPEIGFAGDWISVRDPAVNGRLSSHFGFAAEVRPYGDDGVTEGRLTAVNRYSPSPIHLVTTAALDHLADLTRLPIDRRRFRPSVLVRTDCAPDFVERQWIGSEVTIGDVTLLGTEEAKRCALTFIAQPSIEEEPEVLRNVVRHNRRNFGIYLSVSVPGAIRTGDPVYV